MQPKTWSEWAEWLYDEYLKLEGRYPEWIDLTTAKDPANGFEALAEQTEDILDAAVVEFASGNPWPELNAQCGAILRLRLDTAIDLARQQSVIAASLRSGVEAPPSQFSPAQLKLWFLKVAWHEMLVAQIHSTLEDARRADWNE